jgi:CRISPR type IV-associated DEAD/DEAH-box helicase Csf4
MGGTSKLYYPITALWKAATGGAVLASATLYLPDPAGGQTCDYLRSVLYLPIERIHAPQPIVAPYLYTLPTLHYPKGDELQKKLSAPKTRSMTADEQEKAENEWLSNVANVLADGPAKTAKGGTMILCTSYTQVEKLAQFLLDRDVGVWRIVEQKRGGKFSDLRLKFIESAHKGQRPIMLALGAAWTGVDFMDERFSGAPEKDMLLTDLAIVRCPIGLNRSYAMLERFDKQGTYPISCEALLVLKQGLGRLIRQDGVKDRHIWFLDGRLWQPWFKMENFTAAARNMLGKYENIKEL